MTSPAITRAAWALAWLGATVPLPGAAQAPPREGARPAAPAVSRADEILLEVRLDDSRITDALLAYTAGRDVLLPLGELARLLTLAIRTEPADGTATGYILQEQRTFHLDTARSVVVLGGKEEPFDPTLVRVLADDVYVASALLARWLPLEFEVNQSTLTLNVKPREELPLQARLARERAGARTGRRGAEDRGYRRVETPYRALGMPYVDQTFSIGKSGGGGGGNSANYSAYLTGDFAGMEGAAYISSSRENKSPDVRFSLGRSDPDAGLLGFMQARTAAFGSAVSSPSVTNIALATPTGRGAGVVLSSRPITQPTNFDRHTLEGELPPGWDVELYYNDALVGFQTSRPDAHYRFEDQPLAYGMNEFRLVFHGPLGQVRVERQVFDLEQSTTRPGDFYYLLSQHEGEGRAGSRSVAQFDWGISRFLTADASIVRLPETFGGIAGLGGVYSQVGLRAYLAPFILGNASYRSPSGGFMNETIVKTGFARTALTYTHLQFNDYTSEVFLPLQDPLRTRDTLRFDGTLPAGSLPRLPYTFEVLRDGFESGRSNFGAGGRVAAFVRGTSVSTQLRWTRIEDQDVAVGSTQVSRRIGATGLSAQVGYSLQPSSRFDVFAIAVDQRFQGGYILNLGLTRTLVDKETIGSVALNRDFGRFGLGVAGSRSSSGAYSIGLQLFVAIGQDPRTGRWRFDSIPKADGGAASVRVFIDNNANGSFDAGDEPAANVAVLVNGSRTPGRTDEAGYLWVDRLPIREAVDVAVDAQTLEDPIWQPAERGLNIVPRPGAIAQLDFPVVATSEMEGHVYLVRNGSQRGIGNALVEVVDLQGKVLASVRTSWDGYYVFNGLRQGTYLVRIAPAQLESLGIQNPGVRPVTARADGELLAGIDFILVAAPNPPRQGADTEATPVGPGSQSR